MRSDGQIGLVVFVDFPIAKYVSCNSV